MNDLISRDLLIKHLNACLAESDGGTPITDAVIVAIRSAVENMPNVDAVPVVRCGECKYNNACLTQSFVEDNGIIPFDRDTFFCADGERKEKNNEAV